MNKLETYRLTSQIRRRDHLTSLGLLGTIRALFMEMERADALKGKDTIRNNHQQGPFDVHLSHESPKNPQSNSQTHATEQDESVQTHGHNMPAC